MFLAWELKCLHLAEAAVVCPGEMILLDSGWEAVPCAHDNVGVSVWPHRITAQIPVFTAQAFPRRVTHATSVGRRPSIPRQCVGIRAAAGCEASSVDHACVIAMARM